MKKLLLIVVSLVFIIIIVFVIYVNVSWDRTFDVNIPTVTVSTDSAVIARGKYLVYGPAHCASCHMPQDKMKAVDAGEEYPLSGGWGLDIAPGVFYAPNLTPDKETGIGDYSDGQIARAMRELVAHDGMPLMPFMPFQELSDEDMVAIISFLRSQEPISNKVPRSEYSFLGKMLLSLGAIKPEGPKNTPPSQVLKDSTARYGKYLAHSVANCVGCHTERDLQTGAFIGPDFAGGMVFEPDNFSEGYAFISPNITTDSETSAMAKWDQQAFVQRFKTGRIIAGSPMPWGAFSRMDDVELKALYKYLVSLDPINREVAQVVFEPGTSLP